MMCHLLVNMVVTSTGTRVQACLILSVTLDKLFHAYVPLFLNSKMDLIMVYTLEGQYKEATINTSRHFEECQNQSKPQ